MSRRDIIIVAVLINAGLLIILFASALKLSPDDELTAAAPIVIEQTPDLAFKKGASFAHGDEVDQALSQFSQNSALASVPAQIPQSPLPTTAAPFASQPSDFADDLKMVAQPQLPSAVAVENPALQTLMAPIPPQMKTAPDFVEIKVKKGDVLEKIARHHHSTVAEIMKANKLTSTNLRIGQILKIPNKTMKKADASTISHSAPGISGFTSQAGERYYTVKKGDSPWSIAVKNHIKVEDLLKLNSMSEEQARRLKPGDQLRIQ
jgi:peptidoglycan endopeptidase LytF